MPLDCRAGNVAVETCIIHYLDLHPKGSGKDGFSSSVSMNANAQSSVSQMASECLLLKTSDESPSLKGASHQAYSINNFRLCEFFNGPQWRKRNQRTSRVYQTYLSMLILEHTEQDRLCWIRATLDWNLSFKILLCPAGHSCTILHIWWLVDSVPSLWRHGHHALAPIMTHRWESELRVPPINQVLSDSSVLFLGWLHREESGLWLCAWLPCSGTW